MPNKRHQERELKVLWLANGPLYRHHATRGHSLRAEEAVLVALLDGDVDLVAGQYVGGPHPEDVGRHTDIGGESEVVVGYSHRQGQALASLIANQALTTTVKERQWEENKQRGLEKNKTERERERERKRQKGRGRANESMQRVACEQTKVVWERSGWWHPHKTRTRIFIPRASQTTASFPPFISLCACIPFPENTCMMWLTRKHISIEHADDCSQVKKLPWFKIAQNRPSLSLWKCSAVTCILTCSVFYSFSVIHLTKTQCLIVRL